MWFQQLCHIWGETLYNDSSRLETVKYCGKEFHPKCSRFLGQPLILNITVSSFFLEKKTIIGCFRNFKIIFHYLSSPKTVQRAWLHEKIRLYNEENKTKKSIYPFTSLDGPVGCYFVTELQESLFSKRSFHFNIKQIFCDPWTLVFFSSFFQK